ncbi:hypothetical protein BC834DRAFT_71122 [Gloeopeniophorella convolvens]|nr:hypothetical protein BC834DRAFT_71122 [Gloeopeniophorella convolvens]
MESFAMVAYRGWVIRRAWSVPRRGNAKALSTRQPGRAADTDDTSYLYRADASSGRCQGSNAGDPDSMPQRNSIHWLIFSCRESHTNGMSHRWLRLLTGTRPHARFRHISRIHFIKAPTITAPMPDAGRSHLLVLFSGAEAPRPQVYSSISDHPPSPAHRHRTHAALPSSAGSRVSNTPGRRRKKELILQKNMCAVRNSGVADSR